MCDVFVCCVICLFKVYLVFLFLLFSSVLVCLFLGVYFRYRWVKIRCVFIFSVLVFVFGEDVIVLCVLICFVFVSRILDLEVFVSIEGGVMGGRVRV